MNHDVVTEGVHRFGDGIVNWYPIDEGGDLTVVDTAWPRSWPEVQRAVTSIGRRVEDIRAILLSHGHADHMGAAQDAHEATGLPVRAHRHEIPRLKGQKKGGSSFALVPRGGCSSLPTRWSPWTRCPASGAPA